MTDFRQEFLAFALARDVLRFGDFVTKAGRRTPYFFNAGLFNDGESLQRLGQFYAEAALASGVAFDQLYGPAYKGITLAAALAIALAEKGHNLPFSFNRKETKDHGEGGDVVGAALAGRVLIVDDVISAGTSVRESVDLIRAQGAEPAGVLIALDRMERGTGEQVGCAGGARHLWNTGDCHCDARRSDAIHRGSARVDRGRAGRSGLPSAVWRELRCTGGAGRHETRGTHDRGWWSKQRKVIAMLTMREVQDGDDAAVEWAGR